MAATGRRHEEGSFAGEAEAELLRLLEEETVSGLGSESGKCLERIEIIGEDYRGREVLPSLKFKSWWFSTADNSSQRIFKAWEMTLGEQARLSLLQKIGKCRNLRDIDLCKLIGNDLKMLLTPLQVNPVLNSISIDFQIHIDPIDVERTCEILAKILQTSGTFKSLTLRAWEWSTMGASYLASGLHGNAESALEHLTMTVLLPMEPSLVTQVARMVQCASRLSALTIEARGGWVLDNDTLATALALSSSLKSLPLVGQMEGALALLLKVFTREVSNDSITSVQLHGGMEGIKDYLPRLLSCNHSLKDFQLGVSYDLSPKVWKSLGQALASSLFSEQFVIHVNYPVLNPNMINLVALLTAADVKKPFVEVYLNSKISRDPFKSEWGDEAAEELLQKEKKPILKLHWKHVYPDANMMKDFFRRFEVVPLCGFSQ